MFVLTEEIIESLKELKSYAEKNPYTMDQMLDVINQDDSPAGDQKDFSREIPVGYKVVFTLEEQNPGLCRHISFSGPKQYPSLEAMKSVMEILGFDCKLDPNKDNPAKCHVYEEPIDGIVAVNVIEVI